MIFVFFADTVNAKARQTSTMSSIILASPSGDRETTQASLCNFAIEVKFRLLSCCVVLHCLYNIVVGLLPSRLWLIGLGTILQLF